MTKRSRTAGEYEVGYGKPPADRRFRPGQSGNPKGTPKGGWPKHKRELAVVEEILGRKVTVRNGDTEEQMDVLGAAYLAVAAKATRGDLKALAFLESRRAAALEHQPEEASVGEDDAAIIKNFLARVQGEAADQAGDAPDPPEAAPDQAGGAPNPKSAADHGEW